MYVLALTKHGTGLRNLISPNASFLREFAPIEYKFP